MNDFSKILNQHEELLNERSDWEAEWRSISDYVLPGRGIYQTYSKPRKRKLTSSKTINTIAEDALYVLTSGLHGGLTSPSRPWFKLEWLDKRLNDIRPLKLWIQEAEKLLHQGLHDSNFYSIINSFYIEYGGFGNGCIYMGEDTQSDLVPFRFELLTVGEYSYSLGADGKPNLFFRTLFKTPRQLVELFPNTVSKQIKQDVKDNKGGSDITHIGVLEVVKKENYKDKSFTRIFYQLDDYSYGTVEHKPLSITGFYEFPYPVARWNTIGSDVYGIGPGSRSLPDVKRLQEMEKSFLMATHKTINPPLNAPARMRGKLNTMPGGFNYYANPQEMVKEMYQVKFDYQGVSAAIERVEQRIQRNFFNDIFLTAARDPNASPLKATQVQAQEQEKMLRLGPVIERLQNEFLYPIIERGFNIMLRKELIPLLPPELEAMAGDYNISLISPLATAQRSIALQGINSFLGFVGQAAQFQQEALDNIDIDRSIRDHADISGVNLSILRSEDEVKAIREKRAKQMAAEKKKQEEIALMQLQGEMNKTKAEAQKLQSEAGLNLIEGMGQA